MSNKEKTRLEKFEDLYKKEITNKDWITKDDLAKNGFFPIKGTNGRDIRFIKAKYELEEHREGNKIPKFRVIGLNEEKTTRYIKADIRNKLKKEKCAFLNTRANIEIDHKNGRYNDNRALNTETQTIDDFQALSKTANNMKREACLKCAKTGIKFDAREVGMAIPNLNGEYTHNDKPNDCQGCFWFDPKQFTSSQNFILNKMHDKYNKQSIADEFSKTYKKFFDKD